MEFLLLWPCSIYCRCNLLVSFFLWCHRSTVVMSYCPFSLHKKSQHLWYLVYNSSRIFQKSIIYWIYKFVNVSYLIFIDCFFLSEFTKYLDHPCIFPQIFQGINFPFTTKQRSKIAPSESMITRLSTAKSASKTLFCSHLYNATYYSRLN